MKLKPMLGTTCSMTMARHSRIVCTIRLLLLLVLLALPAVVQAQFNYTTNNGTTTITGYTGPGGAVTIPSTINGLPVTRIGDWAFAGRTSLTSVTISNSIISIGAGAFYDCTSLTEVTLGNSVTSIGYVAFDGCTSLTSVMIGNSVTNIGDYAFAYCTSLTAITVNALNPAFSSVEGVLFNQSQTTLIQYPGGKTGSYTIPNSVTSIGGAFSGCTSLTSATIPNSVTSIGDETFARCTSLTSVTIGSSVTSIGAGAFYDCTSLTNVTIPNSVTNIGDSAFSGCTSLSSVAIPNSITNIGAGAFFYCASLTSVTIPNSVTSIGDNSCGDGLCKGTFSGCTSLTNVTIGNSVTNIGFKAFYSCTNLIGVYFQGNAPSPLNVFYGVNKATVYYLPGTTGWGATFADRPTVQWLPEARTTDADFGVRTNQFGFNIRWASDKVVVVEASPGLSNPVWTPVSTNTLTGGSSYFGDPHWTNYATRFYRLRSR